MRHFRYGIVAGLLLTLAACNTASVPETELEAQAAGRYIVVLKQGAAPGGHAANQAKAAEIARGFGLSAEKTYGSALFGFAARIPEGRLNALKHDPRVAYVEADQVVSTFAQITPTGVRRIFADGNPNLDIDGSDDKSINVDVAVIDTGIDLQHTDLNVYKSTNCSGGSPMSGNAAPAVTTTTVTAPTSRAASAHSITASGSSASRPVHAFGASRC